MPIFFQQDIDVSTMLGIWKIEENEDYFLKHVPLQRNITHPHKRLQHLSGRYLLRHLYPDFPLSLIRIADTKKPFLEDEAVHFSISHCGDHAAVILSPQKRVGVDIELVSDKVARLEKKFLSDGEVVHTGGTIAPGRRSTLAWSCKEAVFKWYGLGGVDFKNHMELLSVIQTSDDEFDVTVLFKKRTDILLKLKSKFFNDLCLSYLVTEEHPGNF